ncbi:hypothetical protein GIB67_022061 [Kingdonia uniflora]|uniref:Retrotransposon Copia-like N-terminal domain-containing protein n=1 Tax=Kingdonia uniflora TaxID=39325 RepID=A0A7J7MUF4_9MAGN|nr:hypothetical protein GIB67_022061 [Kingdonia uniflora]
MEIVSSSSSTARRTISLSGLSSMVSVKLSFTNFLLWRSQILPLLESQELLGYIDGAITSPSLTISNEEGSSEENPEYRKWRLADRFVTNLINSSLTEEAMSETMGTSTSRELWTALEESFSSNHELLLKSLSPPNGPRESAFSTQRGGYGRRDNWGRRGDRGYYPNKGGSYLVLPTPIMDMNHMDRLVVPIIVVLAIKYASVQDIQQSIATIM